MQRIIVDGDAGAAWIFAMVSVFADADAVVAQLFAGDGAGLDARSPLAVQGPPLGSVPSVDPLTGDLPGPGIEHQARRLSSPLVQEGHARMVAAIDDELVARRGDCRDRCA